MMVADEIRTASAAALAHTRATRPPPPSVCTEHPDWRDEIQACADDFRHFLRHWKFRNRDSLKVGIFRDSLWTGQQKLADAMVRAKLSNRWVYALKAGKLGFSELECAYDGWEIVRQSYARVHVFSRDLNSAMELVGWVRFGLLRLPGYFGVQLLVDERGGDTGRSLRVRVAGAAGSRGPDDVRVIYAYAAGKNTGIDQVASHTHVDELSHMPFPEESWGSISTTVASSASDPDVQDGTLHIVTRGAGEGVYSSDLWKAAMDGRDEVTFELLPGHVAVNSLDPVFCNWTERAGRDAAWYATQAANMHVQALSYWAPVTPGDALAGELTSIYIDLARWDSLADEYLMATPIVPGKPEGVVLALDAGVSGDNFGVVAATRHPLDPERPAIRFSRKWTPENALGRIDFFDVERFLRWVCEGGCPAGHPISWREKFTVPYDIAGEEQEACAACIAKDQSIPATDVVMITYDPYQLEDMMQSFDRDHIAWVEPFDQGTLRLKADAFMHNQAMKGLLAHNGDPEMREHIGNAKAKVQPDEESKMRIVKRSEAAKVDLAVAASMAVWQVMDLNLA